MLRCPYPVHFNHIRMPVLGFHSLRVQLRGREGRRTGQSPASPLVSSCFTRQVKGGEGRRLDADLEINLLK